MHEESRKAAEEILGSAIPHDLFLHELVVGALVKVVKADGFSDEDYYFNYINNQASTICHKLMDIMQAQLTMQIEFVKILSDTHTTILSKKGE